jgi:hypothetical protein
MLCQFKLIPGRLLTQKDLSYILTPNELLTYLNRFTDLPRLKVSLPINLQRHSVINNPQGVSQTVSRIRQLVEQGEWVALSLMNQHRNVDDLHLPQGGGLQQRINKVVNPSVTRSRPKIQPTLLHSSSNATSIRSISKKKNDNKIVIEFAGQWPNNAASISISKLKSINEKTLKPKKDSKNIHRSAVEFTNLDDRDRALYLTIPSMNSAKEINLLLSDILPPVAKETEMAEWDNVLVPVIPFKAKNSEFIHQEASLYSSGYIYIVWNNKIWRELKITNDYQFMDVDLTSKHKVDDNEKIANRYVDIALTHPEYGCYFSDEAFEVKQNGKMVFSGDLDVYGQARVFDLSEEKVIVELPQTPGHYSIELDTIESLFGSNKSEIRSVSGHALPHIWLPYKIAGQPQTLYAYHSLSQMTDNQLSELASNPESMAQLIEGMDNYTESQQLINDGVSIIALQPTLSDQTLPSAIEKQNEQGIATLLISSPQNEIIFAYCHHSIVDEPDDYFELCNTEHEWSQKVYLAQPPVLDDGYQSIRFTGWPSEVETVTLKRVNKGNEYHPEQPPIIIYQDIAIKELV